MYLHCIKIFRLNKNERIKLSCKLFIYYFYLFGTELVNLGEFSMALAWTENHGLFAKYLQWDVDMTAKFYKCLRQHSGPGGDGVGSLSISM